MRSGSCWPWGLKRSDLKMGGRKTFLCLWLTQGAVHELIPTLGSSSLAWRGGRGEGTELVWVLPRQWGCLCAGRELSSLFIPATKQEKNTPAECIQK